MTDGELDDAVRRITWKQDIVLVSGILDKLKLPPYSQQSMRVSASLHRLGWTKTRLSNGWVRYVRDKS